MMPLLLEYGMGKNDNFEWMSAAIEVLVVAKAKAKAKAKATAIAVVLFTPLLICSYIFHFLILKFFVIHCRPDNKMCM